MKIIFVCNDCGEPCFLECGQSPGVEFYKPVRCPYRNGGPANWVMTEVEEEEKGACAYCGSFECNGTCRYCKD